MAAYDPEAWHDLFVATAGAAAALAGLVFVAVSINVNRILQFKGLPERALETVLSLLVALIVSIAGLIPGQSTTALGVELTVITVVFTIVVGRLALLTPPAPGDPRRWFWSRMFVRGLAIVPLLVGGMSVLAGSGGGLYWIVAGIVGAIVGSVSNAWVLLVEILR